MICLPQEIQLLFNLVEKAGYKIYLVGGYVRDSLLGINSEDFDLASNMPLDKLENIIANSKIINIKGSNFLSIKFIFQNKTFEITNMRIEGPYKKPGYPSKVTKTDDIYEDLKRRDFTINAIAFSPEEGLIDPYLGKQDLVSKTIKTIKNPELSYKEDPTRILRAYRFAFKLGFTISQNDLNAINKCKHLLKNLSKHQLEKELLKFDEQEKKELLKKGIID